jgi:hypothetical protein
MGVCLGINANVFILTPSVSTLCVPNGTHQFLSFWFSRQSYSLTNCWLANAQITTSSATRTVRSVCWALWKGWRSRPGSSDGLPAAPSPMLKCWTTEKWGCDDVLAALPISQRIRFGHSSVWNNSFKICVNVEVQDSWSKCYTLLLFFCWGTYAVLKWVSTFRTEYVRQKYESPCINWTL